MAKNGGDHVDYERDYCRSLLSPQDLARVKKEKLLTIQEVRDIIRQNTTKYDNEVSLDSEVIMEMDMRIDYPVFIAGDNIYTRDELFRAYPHFEFLKTTPEDVFVQQEIGAFKVAAAPDATQKTQPKTQFEYVARDVGGEDFMLVNDLVRGAVNGDSRPARKPYRVAKSKIYIGKQKWDDFILMCRFSRGVKEFMPQLTFAPRGDSGVGLLVDSKTLEEIKKREENIKLIEKKMQEREERAQEREAQLRERENRLESQMKQLDDILNSIKTDKDLQ